MSNINTMFSQSVIEQIHYYVYCLVDPRNRKIFYIGKGCGNRVFQHAENAICNSDDSLKSAIICDILAEGLRVEHYILRHKLSEEQAYIVESTLIDLLTYNKFNTQSILANIQAGHHQWDEGIKSAEEINQLYDCKPLKIDTRDKLIVVNLSNTYKGTRNERIYRRDSMYEKARKYWKLNIHKAQNADYVLAVYKGVVRAVFKPTKWEEITDASLFKGKRCMFEGYEVKDSQYLNTYIKRNQGDHYLGNW